MSPERTTLAALSLIFIVLIFINPVVFRSVGNFLTFGSVISKNISSADLGDKVEAIRAGLDTPQNTKFAEGNVYSRYPQNLKNELLVDVGTESGVKIGGFAVSNGVLVGRIKEVNQSMSVVQTVFDPNFSLAVRIGAAGKDALLKGGVEPKLTLISKTAVIEPSDIVYSASKDFAYGLPLGSVGPVAAGQNNVFSEADLVFSYNPADIKSLELQKL